MVHGFFFGYEQWVLRAGVVGVEHFDRLVCGVW